MSAKRYVDNVFQYRRRVTREVKIGDAVIGGQQPIRVQSMTTTPTWDVQATVEQIARLADVGCEIVRLTVPSKKDARALADIREQLLKRNITVPLVADIHFAPSLALFCCDHVDKVRINPGNYVDSKRFLEREYTDQEYAEEVDRIEEAFTPLVLRAKERGIAMRIGTNHGSLSDRILNRYGDTPLGMVESALEYVRVAVKNDYHSLVMSMKASNPIVMIQAYRLLAEKMALEDMDYPFHLGVTEAGDGLDARVKSAVGIGSLLADGIGDTIRVSLTEKPEAEVPVGFELAQLVSKLGTSDDQAATTSSFTWPIDPYLFQRRATNSIDVSGLDYGGKALPRVEVDLPADIDPTEIEQSTTGDGIEIASIPLNSELTHHKLQAILDRLASLEILTSLNCQTNWKTASDAAWNTLKSVHAHRFEFAGVTATDLDTLSTFIVEHPSKPALMLEVNDVNSLSQLLESEQWQRAQAQPLNLSLHCPLHDLFWHGIAKARHLISQLQTCKVPLVLGWRGDNNKEISYDAILAPSTALGALLCDGIGDGLRFRIRQKFDGVDPVNVAYTILQATRFRTTRTEYVSCPSCGRTLFDLEETTAKIKELTGHLPNVKIAIMGCIVNGPGEMADADFGYVGWKPGRVDLYVGKEVVEKAIPEDEAPGRLVELLKRHGVWIEKPEAVKS